MSLHAPFRAALLDPEAPLPVGLASWNGSDPQQRFAIYRNNVTVSLIEALSATYPVVAALVGQPFFADCARVYLRQRPPQTPVMARYGAGFADFLAGFPPAASLPYLPDVARLEQARTKAYHARDAEPLGAEAFAALDPTRLSDLTLKAHPSVGLLASRSAVVSLWAAHQGLCRLEAVDPAVPEDALVIRPAFEVEVIALVPGGAAFLGALADGMPLGEAAGRLHDAAHLPEMMRILIQSGFAISLSINEDFSSCSA